MGVMELDEISWGESIAREGAEKRTEPRRVIWENPVPKAPAL